MRPPTIPAKIADNWKEKKYISKLTDEDPSVVLESKIEEDLGDDYIVDYCKNKDLENDEWKYDKIPRFYNGKNIADFITEDVAEKFKTLMEEEKERRRMSLEKKKTRKIRRKGKRKTRRKGRRKRGEK